MDSPGAAGGPVPGGDSGTAAQKSDVGMDKRLSGVLNSLVDPERLAEGGVAHRVRRLRYEILSESYAIDAIPYLH